MYITPHSETGAETLDAGIEEGLAHGLEIVDAWVVH